MSSFAAGYTPGVYAFFLPLAQSPAISASAVGLLTAAPVILGQAAETARTVEETNRQAKADILVFLLAIIAIVGLVLLAIVLVIGSRTRRVTSDPVERTAVDPYASLKRDDADTDE